MPSPSRIASSLLFGTGLGTVPYGAAVAAGGVPTAREITEEKEESKFGEVCMLDEEMCEIMRDETSWTSADDTSGSQDVDPKKPWEKLPESLLKARWDDVCIWGFYDQTLNNLAECRPEEKENSPSTGGGSSSDASSPGPSVSTGSSTKR